MIQVQENLDALSLPPRGAFTRERQQYQGINLSEESLGKEALKPRASQKITTSFADSEADMAPSHQKANRFERVRAYLKAPVMWGAAVARTKTKTKRKMMMTSLRRRKTRRRCWSTRCRLETFSDGINTRIISS